MILASLRRLFARSASRSRARRPARLWLECLEDRTLPGVGGKKAPSIRRFVALSRFSGSAAATAGPGQITIKHGRREICHFSVAFSFAVL